MKEIKLSKEEKEAIYAPNGFQIYKYVVKCIRCRKYFGHDHSKKPVLCSKCHVATVYPKGRKRSYYKQIKELNNSFYSSVVLLPPPSLKKDI